MLKMIFAQLKTFALCICLCGMLSYGLKKCPYEFSTMKKIPDSPGTICETIQIIFVCTGKSIRQLVPLMKSLLYHRQNPVHLHLVTDNASRHVINYLFTTWDLPDVNCSYYNSNNFTSKVSWVPNLHYSGINALLKLVFPEILPATLDKVIVFDTDLTFLFDIAELWSLFNNMSEDQIIGVVENESNWYSDKTKLKWPALGHGFNTGVVLIHLKRLRDQLDWASLWKNTVLTNLPIYHKTMLAEQDVINAIIKAKPKIVYRISCQYNVQMSTHSLAKRCYGEDVSNVKIIHWNSPKRNNIQIRDADYFRNIYKMYLNMNGNILRQKLHKCTRERTSTQKVDSNDHCAIFRDAHKIKFRTHLFYWDYDYSNLQNVDITLSVQLSIDRLHLLERLASHWPGPISAAIYLADCDISDFEHYISEWSEIFSKRSNIGYHLVYKDDTVLYPINYLRNVALNNVKTRYVFIIDVDFVPVNGLYDHLLHSVHWMGPAKNKMCLVIPAFESRMYRSFMPHSKNALLSRLFDDIRTFRYSEWPRGHKATNYTKWITAKKPYDIEWDDDFEPYLLAYSTIPRFDTRFSGFGWNKVSHSFELRARGYKLRVLPKAFIVHLPHAPSIDITKFRSDEHYRTCLSSLRVEFLDDMKRLYNATFSD